MRVTGVLLGLVLTACATTVDTSGVEPSGFLGDYSMLEPGSGDEAQLVYVNPSADLAAYDRILIDSVTVWRTPGAETEVPTVELQRLAELLYQSLARELQKEYRLADRPGRGVLRLRAALTEVQGSEVVADVISTALPQARVVSGITKLATGTHTFVGRAAVEAEIVDSLTGRRLMAGVDERAGGKTVRGVTDTWSDVEEAFAFWASRLRQRLADLREPRP